ncbi:hypothetical protein FALCPG4_011117 [Fusarium falciforme]
MVSFKLFGGQIQDCIAQVPPQTIKYVKTAQENVRKFAEVRRASIKNVEVEIQLGVFLGHRKNPINKPGAYIPGSRYPLLASAHMTIGTETIKKVDFIAGRGNYFAAEAKRLLFGEI